MSITIDHDVINILMDSTIEDSVLILPKDEDGKPIPLERPMYIRVNKVLEALGGKWNRKAGGHIFQADPQDILDQVVLTGKYTDAKKEYQAFFTPPEIAAYMVQKAKIGPGAKVLEPSAGNGAIAKEVLRLTGIDPDCVELNPEFVKALRGAGFDVWEGDFLSFQDHYDIIIANPPFSGQQDIKHVNHMIDLARERVVTIMSSGIKWREDRRAREFRKRLRGHKHTITDIEAGAFKSSGTMVSTVLLEIEI